MILTIQIEVDEQKYKEAIMEGWNNRFGPDEAITANEVGTLDNPEDFQHAMYYLDVESDAIQISVKR